MALLVILAFVGVCLSIQIIAPPCPLMETQLQCVGAGEDCHADVRTSTDQYSNFPTTCPQVGGACKICADDSLVCSPTQVCVRRTVTAGFSCSAQVACLANLVCAGGVCTDPSALWSSPGQFAQNGEPCDPAHGNGDCLAGSGLVCNVLTAKCSLPQVDPVAGSQCTGRISCPAMQFCSLTNTYGGPTLGQKCQQQMSLGSRAGALCSGGDGECGWTYGCVPLNPSEFITQFMRTICVAYYSLPAGRQCTQNQFCQSGQCNGGWCVDPDYSTLGDGCSPIASNECGAWATCGCPAQGGSRYRCVKASYAMDSDNYMAEYWRQKPYLDCLDSNGCQQTTPLLGSCAWRQCKQYISGMTLVFNGVDTYTSTSMVQTINVPADLGIMPPPNSCSGFMTEGVGKYKGWKEIEAGASVAQVSFSVFALIAVLLAKFM